MTTDLFNTVGWKKFSYDPELYSWVQSALNPALQEADSPKHAEWVRCGGTWFVGVNALPNDQYGSVSRGPILSGQAINYLHDSLGYSKINWDQAQISICYPGYPKPSSEESESAHQYRIVRDSAHVDGLLREGPDNRRFLREYHRFILGVPLFVSDMSASPFVVWEGSHRVVRQAFIEQLKDIPPHQWQDVDLTDIYHQTRRKIFATCKRVVIPAKPGESFIVHRHALHGMSAWNTELNTSASDSTDSMRMIGYFRPEMDDASNWLFDD